jgi:aminoglycoside phosphotransferase (APT) family kinase protein
MTDRSTLRRLPGVPRVRLHAAGGRRARLTRALTGASDWRRGVADALAFTGVALTGTAILPEGSQWGWPHAGPDEITAALRTHFPALVILGAVLPRQSGRRRLSLFCHAAGNPLVVKLGNDQASFRTENHALELLTANPLPGIATPRPFGVGVLTTTSGTAESEAIAYVAASALGLHTQRPAIDAPLRTFESDLADRLGSLPAPGGRHPDLVPVHGDLTPWNLRRTDRGLALFDWESVGWGPRGSDIAEYRSASDQIRPWWRGARSRLT